MEQMNYFNTRVNTTRVFWTLLFYDSKGSIMSSNSVMTNSAIGKLLTAGFIIISVITGLVIYHFSLLKNSAATLSDWSSSFDTSHSLIAAFYSCLQNCFDSVHNYNENDLFHDKMPQHSSYHHLAICKYCPLSISIIIPPYYQPATDIVSWLFEEHHPILQVDTCIF